MTQTYAPDAAQMRTTERRAEVVILGGGSTGEAFAAALRRLDSDVGITIVERELLGGECSYFACMPSKALLRPAEIVAAARIAPGAAEALTGELDVERVFWWRDQVTDELDDSSQVRWIENLDVRLVRGDGQVLAPGVVAVDGDMLRYDHLVFATGTSAAIPPIPGLADVEYWTNREATQTREIPERLAVLGGGVVGLELGQFFQRMGSAVTLIEAETRVLPRLPEAAGTAMAEALGNDGIDVRVGARAAGVEQSAAGIQISLEDSGVVEVDRLLVATGRTPNILGLGLEQLADVEATRTGITVDDTMRAGEGVWAIGDVNGIGLLTHGGKYQARIAAINVAGGNARADHSAVPSVAYTDPQVAVAGRTEGDDLVSSTWKVNATARAAAHERPKRPGFLAVYADPARRVLVGAVAVGPEAGEWIGQVNLAIKAKISVDVLRDTIQAYPTFSEAIFFAVRDLPIEAVGTAGLRVEAARRMQT